VIREVFLGFFVLPALAFSLGYFPVLNRLTVALVSPYARADVRKRLYAAALDSLVVASSGVFAHILQSPWWLAVGAVYLLLRDSVQGQSLGKLVFGLVVIDLQSGRPAALRSSVRRNLVFLLPGANVAAAFLETITLVRDVQGQRLGDRLAHTQVVDGLSVTDLAKSWLEWWMSLWPELHRARRPKRAPVSLDATSGAEQERAQGCSSPSSARRELVFTADTS
jgi:uncharacterized RDD family membrane protein YckC